MRIQALAVLAAAVLAGSAGAADDRYDRKLDRAAAEIAASRMGTLRGGFEPGERPVLLVLPDMAEPERPQALPEVQPGVWHDGLAIAVERRSRVSPEL